jgi:hypothetical protein
MSIDLLDGLPEPAPHVAAAMTPEAIEAEKLRKLEAAIPNMPQRDADFARSMIAQHNQRGFLSSKQWPWVEKLTERATRTRTDLGITFPQLVELFKVAGTHLKRPHIRFDRTSCGHPIHMKLTGARARIPGSINVTSASRFGDGTWFGRILPDGRFEQSRDCTPAVVDFLSKFANDPGGVAGAAGIQSGRCCFCGLELTDVRSTSKGYGPICASHYHLPWG